MIEGIRMFLGVAWGCVTTAFWFTVGGAWILWSEWRDKDQA